MGLEPLDKRGVLCHSIPTIKVNPQQKEIDRNIVKLYSRYIQCLVRLPCIGEAHRIGLASIRPVRKAYALNRGTGWIKH